MPVRPRVVIVGGGFGGLFAAKFLRRVPVDVVLVDRTNHHLFQPLLYQFTTGILSAGEIAPPLREVLRKHENVRVELADVTDIDLQSRTLALNGPDAARTLDYDYLIVATGASGSYFGHDEFADYAPGMKTLEDGLELRTRIFGAFEMAEAAQSPAEQQEWLTFVVVGGGPTGVEVAGQIRELVRRSLRRNFRSFDPTSARVLLVEGGDSLLANFGTKLSHRARASLERLGVDVRTSTLVTDVSATSVTLAGENGSEQIRARTKVWAAGVTASPLAVRLAEQSGATTDRAGRISVQPDCTLPGHPEVFAVGDMMALNSLPGVAEVAMQSGIHAARTIKHRVAGDMQSRPFRYRDLGSMATISRFQAIVDFRGLRVSGLAGWLMWVFVHLTFLTGFKNRFFTLTRWTLAILGRTRGERAMTRDLLASTVAVPSKTSPRPNGELPDE